MITIVDYGMGNIQSVRNAFEHLGHESEVVTEAARIARAGKLVLPGVGSFRHAAGRLAGGVADALAEAVQGRQRPILGICLGMQLLATRGTEHGDSAGLGWIPGTVDRIARTTAALRLPHVGWNSIELLRPCALFDGVRNGDDCYFVHSYQLNAENQEDVVAVTDHGGPVTAAVARGHVYGVQFHPEKSQPAGLAILDAFARL